VNARRTPLLILLTALAGVAGCSSNASPAASTATTAPATTAAETTAAQASPSATTSDNPAFDLTGSGDACRMHYMQVDGQTVTLFTLTEAGEVITHVSGPDGSINRNDVHWTAGVSRLTYDFPLTQATDIGAVLYLPDGTSQSCTISAGTGAP
jgi:hypothetical protein